MVAGRSDGHTGGVDSGTMSAHDRRGTCVDEPLQPERFRTLLRRHAGGVVVITAAGQKPVGFTATSFTSVSLEPPLVSFCVSHAASSWSAVRDAPFVGVHVLANHQEGLARRFAAAGVDRFAAPTRWQPGPRGVPVIDDVSAVLVCRTVQRIAAGDHSLVLAEPVFGDVRAGARNPLIYHMGQYRRLADAT